MRWVFGFLIVAGLALPGVVLANGGPRGWVHSAVQKGQDVEVTLTIVQLPPAPETSDVFTVFREHESETVLVVEDQRFTMDDSVFEEDFACVAAEGASEEECADHPDNCADCDGDGIPECHEPCVKPHRVKVIDECVPVGEVAYRLGYGDEYLEGDCFENECTTYLDVEDTGDSCLDAASTDADSSDSCSVTFVGREVAPHVLALIMLAIGLVAARAGGKR